MKRRSLLGTAVACATGVIARPTLGAEADEKLTYTPKSNAPRLPRREYGKTGLKVSVIGFPGYALRDTTPKEQPQVNRLIAETIERGVNFFDVAAEYGNAEEAVGPALVPYRKELFLSSKTAQRTAEGAAAELKRSFERLHTDYLEVYNLHHIGSVKEDVDVAFGKGGAMETLMAAKKDGRVRHLGFSAHSVEAALAALDRYDFDSAVFPINFATMTKGKWGPPIIERCQKKGVAIFALKALARQHWPKDDPKRSAYPICWYQPVTDLDEAEYALRFTLSQPVVAALPPSSDRLHRLAMMLAMDFKPLSDDEQKLAAKLAENLDPVFKVEKPA